jgi:shikimate kinase
MKHIVLIGFQNVGKSVIAAAIAKQLHKAFFDLDDVIEQDYLQQYGATLSCREMLAKHGEVFFRQQEEKLLPEILSKPAAVIALGGGAALAQNNQRCIQPHCVVLVTAAPEVVLQRMLKKGLPSYFSDSEPPATQFYRLWHERHKIYQQLTPHVVINNTSVDQAVAALCDVCNQENKL